MSIKLGDVIKLDDMEIAMKGFYDELNVAHTAFMAASAELTRIKHQMFDAIREQHPELYDFEFSVSPSNAVAVQRLPNKSFQPTGYQSD